MIMYDGKGQVVKQIVSMDGMTIATLGDSFSAPNAWQTEMQKYLKCTIVNKAISGGRFSYNSALANGSAYEQASQLSGQIDVICLFFGVNDINNNVPIGSFSGSQDISTFDASTVIGGLQKALCCIQNKFPKALIRVGWTPSAWAYLSWEKDVDSMTGAIRATCDKYGVKYIDTLTCGISKLSASYNECWEAGASGGHPTGKGHAYIGEYIAKKLISEY